jgi:hypothetical protein
MAGRYAPQRAIGSGYSSIRVPATNKRVGERPSSSHLESLGSDFETK